MNNLTEYADNLEFERALRYSINEAINEELEIANDVMMASIVTSLMLMSMVVTIS